MKTVFNLQSGRNGADTLLLELGPDHCCYAMLDSHQKSFDQIRYLGYDEFEIEEKLHTALEEINGDFETVRVCSNYPQALLSPKHLFTGEYSLLEVLFDGVSMHHLNDVIPEWQVTNLYSLPSSLYQLVHSKFPNAQYCHAYTPVLKIYNGFVAPDQVDIHFSINQFRIIVKKGGQLQLAQTYKYKTPLDVVYYLLKIFSEFHLDQSEAFLVVSGLLEKDSALYYEMHNYFVNIHFAHAPEYSIPGDAHPQYYFTSLYNLAACG